MTTHCPIEFDADGLRQAVVQMYRDVALDPLASFHFHRGPDYAARWLGYDAAALAALPSDATASFAGVANPLAMAQLQPGQAVLDVGCGSATDLLLAAGQVGPRGRAIGVDLTDAMRERARGAARQLGYEHVDVREGDFEALPVADETVDVVISNGALNLSTDKSRTFEEIARVLRPGGLLLLGDIAVDQPLPASVAGDLDLWAS